MRLQSVGREVHAIVCVAIDLAKNVFSVHGIDPAAMLCAVRHFLHEALDGWKMLYRANGSGFKNQDDCIQYVNTGK